ncbi:hypothetical protein ACFFYR_38170, partial [Paraburkholderia dipogonis]|uniref:hypothetical protein n=1 Tax=Paraburkholderia dipogonis TaxID=1211383 RepID=UPI0035F0340E
AQRCALSLYRDTMRWNPAPIPALRRDALPKRIEHCTASRKREMEATRRRSSLSLDIDVEPPT